jgi:hypothetical protein
MNATQYSSRSTARRAAVREFPEGNFEVVPEGDKFVIRGLEIEITADGEKFVAPELHDAPLVVDSIDALDDAIADAKEEQVQESPFMGANVFGAMMAQIEGKPVAPLTVGVSSRQHKLDDSHTGCPLCGAEDSDVTYVEPNQASDDMRRECHSCGERFNRTTGQRIRSGYRVENTARGHKIQKGLPEQNGVKQRSAGTLCHQVWELCDQLRAANDGVAPTSKDMRREGAARGWNMNNVLIEMYQWRKFHGIVSEKKK